MDSIRGIVCAYGKPFMKVNKIGGQDYVYGI